MTFEKIRELLSSETVELFDDIKYSRVLGASKHIEMIFKMMKDIVDNRFENDRMLSDISLLVEYFIETRGSQSRAVYNVLTTFKESISKLDHQKNEALKLIINNQIDYQIDKITKDIEKIVMYASNLCEGDQSIMVFDYSSTVERFIMELNPQISVYIAESRALDGGRPFLKASIESKHHTVFFPDTMMMENLKKCQKVFIGAESFYTNGEVINTIGSDILALLCKELNKPLYVLTPMNKLDDRNKYGYYRNSKMEYDYSVKIAKDWDTKLIEAIDFNGIKLIGVAPEYITGIVTEFGIIPPHAMYLKSEQYLEGKKND